ncbi:MAG: hypothetical protein ACFWTW_03420 [Lentilactobacillus parabuchneri]|jgi:hypothetical protein|uniref:hypothetical protein n=1 Tax=Lentilactobacillus parabuchneri TaxID=152331 RepID=UPI003A5BED71
MQQLLQMPTQLKRLTMVKILVKKLRPQLLTKMVQRPLMISLQTRMVQQLITTQAKQPTRQLKLQLMIRPQHLMQQQLMIKTRLLLTILTQQLVRLRQL